MFRAVFDDKRKGLRYVYSCVIDLVANYSQLRGWNSIVGVCYLRILLPSIKQSLVRVVGFLVIFF